MKALRTRGFLFAINGLVERPDTRTLQYEIERRRDFV